MNIENQRKRLLLFAVFLFCFNTLSLAQPVPETVRDEEETSIFDFDFSFSNQGQGQGFSGNPPGDPPIDPADPVPIGGIEYLLAAGGILGIRKWMHNRKKNKGESGDGI